MSKTQLIQQITQLEQDVCTYKEKASTLTELNTELKSKLEKSNKAGEEIRTENASLNDRLEALEAENNRLKKDLDGYITKNWRDFCAMQESPTLAARKRAYSKIELE
jgi:predicted nuclease with TOPRIM domain